MLLMWLLPVQLQGRPYPRPPFVLHWVAGLALPPNAAGFAGAAFGETEVFEADAVLWELAVPVVTLTGGQLDPRSFLFARISSKTSSNIFNASSSLAGSMQCDKLCLAYLALTAAGASTPPVVISLPFIKLTKPLNIVRIDQLGSQDSGWKSDMEKQILLLGLKRPLGVRIIIEGGLNGYSFGNCRTPWYTPPS